MSLLDKVYDKYETLDFQYGQDNLNPVREITLRKTSKLSESMDTAYSLIKKRIAEIEKDTQPLIEKELNDSVVTGISPFEQSFKIDDGMNLSAAKAGTTGNYVFPNVTPKYTDAGLRIRIQLLMSQLSSIIDTYPDEDIEDESDNPVNDIQDRTFIDSVCDIQADTEALLTATFSKSSNMVSLQWPKIESASYYRVSRKKENGEFENLPYTIADTGVLSYSIQDTGLAFSTTYSYKVIPFDSNNNALTESNIEKGTTINSPDADIKVSFSSITYKTTVNWLTFLQKNSLVPLTDEEPYTFTINDINYHFVRFEVYRGTSSEKDNLYKKANLFTTQDSISTYKLTDSTQLALYADTHINYIVCAVFATEEQYSNIENVESFDDTYYRVWSSIAGCVASASSDYESDSESSLDTEDESNGNDTSGIQDLINELNGADDTGDQLDTTSLAKCAIQDLGILNMVLSVLSVITVIINVINLILFVTSQLISIVQLAAACWNNPTNIGKIISMVSERIMAIAINLIGKLIAELLSNLNVDCTSEMTAEVLNKIQSILNSSYNLSSSGVLEPLNMANSTWKSAIELRKTLSEQFGSQSTKINEILSEAKTSLLSTLNSNPATAAIVSLVNSDGNIDWTKLTSLVRSVPELSSVLKAVDAAKGTVESVGQFKNLGTEWKNATTKWTWE